MQSLGSAVGSGCRLSHRAFSDHYLDSGFLWFDVSQKCEGTHIEDHLNIPRQHRYR